MKRIKTYASPEHSKPGLILFDFDNASLVWRRARVSVVGPAMGWVRDYHGYGYTDQFLLDACPPEDMAYIYEALFYGWKDAPLPRRESELRKSDNFRSLLLHVQEFKEK
ncbi:UNVERIFIED_CONTAM: hypothetical protein HDU68_008963 [Siphonaria sp. JEL0065]|nr:hypothetical protein HDU68_008963 [Siphonaria sp. JEL0065]